MKKKLLALSLAMVVILTTACGKNPKLKNGEEVVFEAKGYKVSAEKFYEELKKQGGYSTAINMVNDYIAGKEIEDSDEINSYVDGRIQYIESYLTSAGTTMDQYLSQNGLGSVDDLRTIIKNQRKYELAITKQIGSKFTDEEVENYYNTNYSEKIPAKHILIKFDEDEDDYDEAYNTALNIIGKLNETDKKDLTKTFDDLALEYSADSTYNNGGLIENFMASEVVPEFWDASKALKANEYTTEPVKSQYGYHVILKVSETDKLSLKDADKEIREKLAEQKKTTDSLADDVAAIELYEKYNFKIYDTDIEKFYNDFKDSVN